MKYIHSKAYNVLEKLIGNESTNPLLFYIRETASGWDAPGHTSVYSIHAHVTKITQDNELEFGVMKKDWQDGMKDFLDFMRQAGLPPEFDGGDDTETMAEPFEDYVDQYLETYNAPEGKDCTAEFIIHMAYYLLGVDDSENSQVIEHFEPLTELNGTSREKDSYKNLLREYDAQKPDSVDPEVLKSLEPVDVSSIPEYVIDSLYKHGKKYYKPSDVRKMITASSQVAQALEGQDLEDELTTVNMSAEEQGRHYLKKLKLKRMKKDEQSKGNVVR